MTEILLLSLLGAYFNSNTADDALAVNDCEKLNSDKVPVLLILSNFNLTSKVRIGDSPKIATALATLELNPFPPTNDTVGAFVYPVPPDINLIDLMTLRYYYYYGVNQTLQFTNSNLPIPNNIVE